MNKNFKKITSFLLVALFVVASFTSVYAVNEEIQIYVNGSRFSGFEGPRPVIVNNRIFLPYRAVGQVLGFTATWDYDKREATLYNKNMLMIFTIGAEFILTKDRQTGEQRKVPFQDDICPFILDGYTMFPLRTFAEASGVDIEWDSKTKSVYIIVDEEDNPEILGIAINPAKTHRGETVTLTVKTNTSTNYVWAEYNAFRNPMKSHALFASNDSGVKTWTVDIDPDGYFCVYANTINGELDAAYKEMEYDEATMSYKDYHIDIPNIDDFLDFSDLGW